jgi:hypothetical protein
LGITKILKKFAFALALILAPIAGVQGVVFADEIPDSNLSYEPLQHGRYYDPEDASETVFMLTPEVTVETEEELEAMQGAVSDELEADHDELEENHSDPEDDE